jgi:hypothetical protein
MLTIDTAISNAIFQLKCGASAFRLLSAPSHIVVSVDMGLARIVDDGLRKVAQLSFVNNLRKPHTISETYLYP